MAFSKSKHVSEIPQATLTHFTSIPWVHAHLSDTAFHPVHLSRTLTHHGTGHTLMASTWNTPGTIAHIMSLYRPPRNPRSGEDGGPGTDHSVEEEDERAELRRFYTFGNGLNAHPGLLHGGVIATILDSTMGNIIALQFPDYAATFTVKLTVEYKRPVKTPGTIMARAWVVTVEGRKVFVKGQMSDEDGRVCAVGEGVWVRARGGEKL